MRGTGKYNQEILRDKCRYLINYYGTTQQFIGKSTGIRRSTINAFMLGKTNLGDDYSERLIKFLDERNVEVQEVYSKKAL